MDTLKKATRSNNAFVRDRAKILLLSSQRYIPWEIADKTGCEARKVRNAIKIFNQHGLKTLNRGKAPGAESKFSKEQKAQILMIAATEPEKLKLHFTTWSLQKLQQYLIQQGIVNSISIETIRCLLKQAGMKLRKSKRFQYSNDPLFAKKNYGSTRWKNNHHQIVSCCRLMKKERHRSNSMAGGNGPLRSITVSPTLRKSKGCLTCSQPKTFIPACDTIGSTRGRTASSSSTLSTGFSTPYIQKMNCTLSSTDGAHTDPKHSVLMQICNPDCIWFHCQLVHPGWTI